MSEAILQRSKLLLYFQLDPTCKSKQIDKLYQPVTLPLTIYHFHYPSLYFPTLFRHFNPYLPPSATSKNIRIRYKGEELPFDLPIGLFVDNAATISVGVSEWECAQGFKLMTVNWKKAYTIVNPEGGCDHLFKKLSLAQLMELYQLHLKGYSHGLHKVQKYEGNAIALKLVIGGVVVQRMENDLKLTVGQYLQKQFGDILGKMKVYTHGVLIDPRIKLKQLLQEWNYNDGYCYLKLVPA